MNEVLIDATRTPKKEEVKLNRVQYRRMAKQVARAKHKPNKLRPVRDARFKPTE